MTNAVLSGVPVHGAAPTRGRFFICREAPMCAREHGFVRSRSYRVQYCRGPPYGWYVQSDARNER